ncbi:MAG: bifunctional aspartate kinase/homoserine dehydrogenase I [Flavobacteriaceae bacterium]|nr:MAG: bifunctional aspartate kinase/homoserine dehydrogenase I [Flavobacteriaceae bacterium]
MKVLKFGGSSLSSAQNIEKVKQIVLNQSENTSVVCVFSAFGDTTDLLLEAGNLAAQKGEKYQEILQKIRSEHLETIEKLFLAQSRGRIVATVSEKINELESILEGISSLKEFSKKTQDKVLGYGEELSNYIISEYFIAQGLDATLLDARAIIKTENTHPGAKVKLSTTNKNIQNLDLKNQISVVAGFISSSLEGDIPTTLGRGGSDYTAALFSGALKAEELQVWKDVNGMLTANPQWVKTAKTIDELTYEEALELSHFGANVLYPPTVQPALLNQIPIRIKNTFNPDHPGTLICKDAKTKGPVKGLSSISDIGLVTISGSEMFGFTGFSKRFFETLSRSGINIIMITQGSSEHSITIAISQDGIEKAKKEIEKEFKFEISNNLLEIKSEKELSILALVGLGMKAHTGISGKMFGVLGKNGVNIRAIAQGSSETNITAVIAKKDLSKALNVLNEAFFEEEIKELNLFVVGVGNVGSQLLQQIESQQEHLLKERKLRIKIVGIANSKKMLFAQPIELQNWKQALEQKGEPLDLQVFTQKAAALNLRNSVMVDNTASDKVAAIYEDFLQNSIGIVTCNKIAASSELSRYKNLKKLSRDKNAPFLFETNVGAGLPIIDTLKSLVASGDKIREIKGVLSGSLTFIFNEFQEGTKFVDIVKRAQSDGYTEPDPRIDLSGVDVARKVLILSREAGYPLEMQDIENKGFLDDKYLKGEVKDFFELLDQNQEYFNSLRVQAQEEGKRLKFVGSFVDGKASVGLEKVGPDHPFYNVEGKDNIVMLFTDRYPSQPMIIKGAGAGSEVTASGVFADIIRFASI